MNGLKVYLKSEIGRVYSYIQIAVGLLLLANAIRHFDSITLPLGEVVLNAVGAAILLGALAIPERIRRGIRHLPGILLILSGAILIWNATSRPAYLASPWFDFLLYVGIGASAIGLFSPILHPKLFLFFSKSGIRGRVRPFRHVKISWEEVESVEMGEKSVEVHTKTRVLRVYPYQISSARLRAHIDEICREQISNCRKKNENDDQQTVYPGEALAV